MALTEKGQYALTQIQQYFPTGSFTAKDLSDACGTKIVAAVLNAVANNGYINKLGGSPVAFEAIDSLEEIMANAIIEQKKGCDNSNLATAKRVKNDEFYTRYEDIEAEVMLYKNLFKNKIVYLPCDDPAEKKSEFWSFFVDRFDAFGLKKLIATHYDETGKAYKIWIEADTTGDGYIDDADALQEDLVGNGDFRSPECMEILKECDIVCTNPPFSLFKEFVPWICDQNKDFLIIGPLNATTYKEVFPYIKSGVLKSGYKNVRHFTQPDGSEKNMNNTFWYTNMTVSNPEELICVKSVKDIDYPKMDYYDAIFIDKVENIPYDYDGCMAVPISIFQGKLNRNQFEVLGTTEGAHSSPDNYHYTGKPYGSVVNKVPKYKRLFIKFKK